MTIIGLAIVIAFIVFSTAKLKWHPFLVLVLAAFLTAFFYGMPLPKIADTVGTGFGSILGSIGLVIVFGTIIGLVMERTGAAVVMAESVIKVLGERFPTLTMSVIGAIVSIPVFCDSGYVILNSLKETLAKRLKVSSIAMSVALATGLGEADLPLLEMAVTDRSGGVRQAAAQVLLHLPGSGLVQRAEALAASHMSVTKRFLRTTRVDCRPIEVTDEVLRDEYGERGTGDPSRVDVGPPAARRAAAGSPPALLEEVVGRVPIDRWPALIGLSAGQLLEAEVTFEGKPLDLSSALFTADRRGSGALIEACTADAFKRGDLDRFTDMRRYWPCPYSAEHSRRMVSFLRSALDSHRTEDIGYWATQEAVKLPVSCHATVLPEALALMEEVSRPDSAPAFVTDAVEGLRLRLQLEALRTPPS